MRAHALQPAPRTITYTPNAGVAAALGGGAMKDDDAIKTSVATNVAAQEYTGGALNGVIGGAAMNPPRGLTITRSAAAASYTLDPYTITYKHKGQTKTVLVTPPNADGGDVLNVDVPVEQVTKINIPAQVDAAGTFKFGVGDVYANQTTNGEKLQWEPFRKIMGLGTGTIKVQYTGDGTAAYDDALPTVAGRVHDCEPIRIYQNGTDVAFTLYE